MSEAGIQVNLVPQSFNTIIGESAAVQADRGRLQVAGVSSSAAGTSTGPASSRPASRCSQTGATSNAGSYSDPQMDNLINLTHTSNSLAVFQQYATYAAEQLPVVIWTSRTTTTSWR